MGVVNGMPGGEQYYISAYGIAVKHGFTGSEEEWLEFLKARLELDFSLETGFRWRNIGEDEWQSMDALDDTFAALAEAARQAAQALETFDEAKSAAQAAEQAAQEAMEGLTPIREEVQQAKSDAESAASRASASANGARRAAAAAAQERYQAQTEARAAKGHAQAAAGSLQAVQEAAQNAVAAAQGAGESETQAGDYAQQAESSAQQAASSAGLAAEKARNAGASASAAQAAAEAANANATHPPMLVANSNHWWIWDETAGEYVESNIDAGVSLQFYHDVETLDPDQNGYAENMGTPTNAILRLYLPRGLQGIQGPQGIQGVQGEQGIPGPIGISVASVEHTGGTGEPGTQDTYTITLTDGRAFSFLVSNGRDGEMAAEVYDPNQKRADVYRYADDAAKEAAELAIRYARAAALEDLPAVVRRAAVLSQLEEREARRYPARL